MSDAVMSIFLHTPDIYDVIAITVQHLQRQTIAEQLELLVITYESAPVQESDFPQGVFHSVRIVRLPDDVLMSEVRAAGIHYASTPIVTYAEDHAFPVPEWAAALVAAHDASPMYAVVGPEMVNANPQSSISWSDILIGYGPWLEPLSAGPMERLPGHNASYKREIVLREIGDRLDTLMDTELFIFQILREKGYTLYVEPKARIYHVNFSKPSRWLEHLYNTSRVFAGLRTENWPLGKRLIYAGGSPLIPLIRLKRIYPDIARSTERRRLLWKILPMLMLGLSISAIGEFMGYAFGLGESPKKLIGSEVKRLENVRDTDRQAVIKQYGQKETISA